jgi:hypothetical protein
MEALQSIFKPHPGLPVEDTTHLRPVDLDDTHLFYDFIN